MVAVGLLSFSDFSGKDQGNLIRGLSEFRVDGHRFFRASSSPFDKARYERARTAAELFLLSAPDSIVSSRLRALIAVGADRLHEASEILEKIIKRDGANAEVLNDLGVVYCGLGKENPSNYFRALQAFERSALLSSHAAVPRFNAVLAYL